MESISALFHIVTQQKNIELGIVLGTLVSEDLAAISAGTLVAAGSMGLAKASAVTALGIFLGDVLLWLAGRGSGRFLARSKCTEKFLKAKTALIAEEKLRSNLVEALIVSRFVPGMRLPVYLAAGFVGTPILKTLLVFFAASCLWAPLIVYASAQFGGGLQGTLANWLGSPIAATVLLVLAMFLLLKITLRVGTKFCTEFPLYLKRHCPFEFWPAWSVYAPLVPYILALAVRNRSLMAPTVSNPFVPFGGMVGESKTDIMAQLPKENILHSVLIKPGPLEERWNLAQSFLQNPDFTPPVVLKPDAGQRGAGVLLAQTAEDVLSYLRSNKQGVVLQKGEELRLCFAGNHCQGTQFLDGSHLNTPELQAAVNKIATQINGFYFGRFDIRYASAEELKVGRNFFIVELNAATSESTNIYDPSFSLRQAYSTLFFQWKILFIIGRKNMDLGHHPARPFELIKSIRTFYKKRDVNLISS